jgi:Xaa-Pro aminopeptidase
MNETRIKKLQEKIEHPYLMLDLYELKYFAGYKGSFAGMLVTKDDYYFVTDGRYRLEYEPVYKEHFRLLENTMLDTFSGIIKSLGLEKLSLNLTRLKASEYFDIKEKLIDTEIVSDNTICDNIRLYKTKEEIERFNEAIKITEEGWLYILSFLKEGLSEKDVAVELEHAFKLKGADDLSFPLIVLFGSRSSFPHGKPSSDVKLKNGDVVLIDMGVIKNGYCSDITRTVVFGNNKNSDFKKAYYAVLNAQKKAFDQLKPKVSSKYIDSVARNYLKDEGYGDFFTHGLGHGIGMEIHEIPRLSPLNDAVLDIGMVFSNEPGVYIPNRFGVRIEDMVVLRKNGGQHLTSLPKDEILYI